MTGREGITSFEDDGELGFWELASVTQTKNCATMCKDMVKTRYQDHVFGITINE